MKMNHISFVACCIVIAMLVPDMFDNHLAESMRYVLLMRDTSVLEKKQILPGFAGLKPLASSTTTSTSSSSPDQSAPTEAKKVEIRIEEKGSEKDDNETTKNNDKK